MSFNEIFDFTNSGNNNIGHDNSNTADDLFNMFNWGNNTGSDLYTHQHAGHRTNNDGWYLHPSNIDGPSHPYTGVEVLGGQNDFPDLDDPTTAPTTLYPTNQVPLQEGHNASLYLDTAVSTFSSQPTTIPPLPTHDLPSPVPTPSHGSWSLSSNQYAVPEATTHNPHTPSQVVPNYDDLGFDFFTAAGSSTLPTVHPPSTYIPSQEELWGQIPEPGPSYRPSYSAAPSNQIVGVTPPTIPLPTPFASSSGPQRSRKCMRESRKYNPVRPTKKNGDSDEGKLENGWDAALTQFRAKLHDIVRSGQPSGGLSPEMALAAKIAHTVKEDLKRSPLQDTKAGEGRRPRNVEDYFAGLLREIPPVKLTPVPGQRGSREDSTKAATFARLADVLEAMLVAVNQDPTLRHSSNIPQAGKGTRLEQTEDRVKKNRREKAKRDGERYHLERIGHLFKVAGPRQTWTRVEVLSFAMVFLLYGSSAFSPGFIKVASTMQGL